MKTSTLYILRTTLWIGIFTMAGGFGFFAGGIGRLVVTGFDSGVAAIALGAVLLVFGYTVIDYVSKLAGKIDRDLDAVEEVAEATEVVASFFRK